MNWNFLIQVEFLWDLLVSIVMVYFFDVGTYPASWMEATDAFHTGCQRAVCVLPPLSTSNWSNGSYTSKAVFVCLWDWESDAAWINEKKSDL